MMWEALGDRRALGAKIDLWGRGTWLCGCFSWKFRSRSKVGQHHVSCKVGRHVDPTVLGVAPEVDGRDVDPAGLAVAPDGVLAAPAVLTLERFVVLGSFGGLNTGFSLQQ